LDLNLSDKNQLFYRFSYVDDPQFIPAIFGGIADGGGFQQGDQTANAQQSALAYTHTFSPTLINVLRGGLNYLHTTRNIPAANDQRYSGFRSLSRHSQVRKTVVPATGVGGLQTSWKRILTFRRSYSRSS
jgi:hypothetical protein